jgi:hypothetical protein
LVVLSLVEICTLKTDQRLKEEEAVSTKAETENAETNSKIDCREEIVQKNNDEIMMRNMLIPQMIAPDVAPLLTR